MKISSNKNRKINNIKGGNPSKSFDKYTQYISTIKPINSKSIDKNIQPNIIKAKSTYNKKFNNYIIPSETNVNIPTIIPNYKNTNQSEKPLEKPLEQPLIEGDVEAPISNRELENSLSDSEKEDIISKKKLNKNINVERMSRKNLKKKFHKLNRLSKKPVIINGIPVYESSHLYKQKPRKNIKQETILEREPSILEREPSIINQEEPNLQYKSKTIKKDKSVRIPSLSPKHLIQKNNINKIRNKTKNQNETMNTNISIIRNEIDNLLYIYNVSYNDLNTIEIEELKSKIQTIINYLEKHIKEFMRSTHIKPHQKKELINKQYYYRLLTETNLIIKIIKEINNINSRIGIFFDFITFLKKDNKENTYTTEEINKEIEQLVLNNKHDSHNKDMLLNINLIDNEIQNLIQEKKNININESKKIDNMGYTFDDIYTTIIKYLKKFNATFAQMFYNKEKIPDNILFEHNFIVKILTDKQINFDKNKKLNLLFKFVEFIVQEHTKYQSNTYNLKSFDEITKEMINKYIITKNNTTTFKNTKQNTESNSPEYSKQYTKIQTNRRIENNKTQLILRHHARQKKEESELVIEQINNKINDLINTLINFKHDISINLYEILHHIIKDNTTIKINNIIDKEILIRIFEALLINNSVKKLNLSNILNKNNFNKETLIVFLNYINSKNILEEFNISSCDIDPHYFSAIIYSILSNPNLKIHTLVADNTLNLSNDFGSLLSKLLEEKSNSLRKLSLSKCLITDAFFYEIITNLAVNTVLEEVNLSSNNISMSNILELVKLLLNNKTSKMIINLCNLDTNQKCDTININNIKLLVNDSNSLISNYVTLQIDINNNHINNNHTNNTIHKDNKLQHTHKQHNTKYINNIIINTNMITNKNQDKNIEKNITIIDLEIDKFNRILQDLINEPKPSTLKILEITYVINYLKKHIQKLLYNRGKVLNTTTKKSLFNKLLRKKQNTEEQTIIKKSYYRILLETNFIVNVIKNIKEQNIKINKLYMFLKFLKKKERENKKYTIEEFNEYTQL